MSDVLEALSKAIYFAELPIERAAYTAAHAAVEELILAGREFLWEQRGATADVGSRAEQRYELARERFDRALKGVWR